TYTFRVVNNGPDTATGVFTKLSSPGSYHFVSRSSPDGWTCLDIGTSFPLDVTCYGGNIASGATLLPGQGATMSVTAAPVFSAMTQTVTATADPGDKVHETNEGNNSLSITTTVW